MNTEINTYWNSTGTYQAAADALRLLIPVEGQVPNAKNNPALEAFRKGQPLNPMLDTAGEGRIHAMRLRKPKHKYPVGTAGILNRVLKVPGLWIGQPVTIAELGQTTERVRIEAEGYSAWVEIDDLIIK